MADDNEEEENESWRRVPRPPGSFPPTKLVARKSAGVWPRAQTAKKSEAPTKHDANGIVWGKLGVYPWWPCQKVTDQAVIDEYSRKLQLRKPRTAETLVRPLRWASSWKRLESFQVS